MIGTLLGIGIAITYIGAAWDAKLDEENWFNDSVSTVITVIAVLTIVGVFLFPRTIGFAFTPSIFVTPIAFITGWIRHGFGHGITMLTFGLLMWLSTMIVAKFRPSST